MKASLRTDQKIEEEAAQWLARLHSDSCTVKDEERFRAWLTSDARHTVAFEELTSAWEALGQVRWPVSEPARSRGRFNRRTVLSGIAASAISASGLVGWSAAYAGVYQTDVGEQKRVVLPDGTRVMLDTDTKIRFRDGEDGNEVRLYRGQASFIAYRPTAAPLQVCVGQSKVLAQRSTFDVQCDDGALSRLVVADGSVRVTNDGALPNAYDVRSGEVVSANMPKPTIVDGHRLAQVTAWHGGRLVFSNDDVATAVSEMNRYSDNKLTCLDDAVATMKISGTFHVGDTEGFAKSLALALPVQVMRTDDSIGIKSL
ncbi:FecR iron sensor protein [Sphingomonas sp. LH128]|uniref:FecR family protein n=1 Tax=Sphingomonas sp. LH128 TaxID=473781 RepID=UPI00027C9791|nr:FecR domain-containing protein [Sphingomonas sp. LH128]EJU11790.1 FecR iron sensor protein [Sphingomonas sp. LH128]